MCRFYCGRVTHLFFFSSRRRHTRLVSDWSSDVCSSDLGDLREIKARSESQAATLNPNFALRPACGRSNPCDARLELRSIRGVQENRRVDVKLAVCFDSRSMLGQCYDRRAFLETLSELGSHQCYRYVHDDSRTLNGVGGHRPPFLCAEQFDELADFVSVFVL